MSRVFLGSPGLWLGFLLPLFCLVFTLHPWGSIHHLRGGGGKVVSFIRPWSLRPKQGEDLAKVTKQVGHGVQSGQPPCLATAGPTTGSLVVPEPHKFPNPPQDLRKQCGV